jgi:regulator of sigma E protease
VPTFLLFLIVIAVLIIGHELGHFLAAKALGIEVSEFGIGFPPRIASLFKIGDTIYTLNLIPLGGFVRVSGENDPSIANGLSAASKRERAIFLLAGPAANVLMAIFAFSIAFKFAAPDPKRVTIADIASNSPAAMAGIQINDLVLSINEHPISSVFDMQQVINDNLELPTRIIVQRDDTEILFTIVPRSNPPQGEGAIGVLLGNPQKEVGWGEAFQLAIESTQFQFSQIIHLPAMLAQGKLSPDEARLTGYKGMYDMLAWAGEIDRTSQRPFLTLNLIGVISASLAIANLLPIPALDGGRLSFLLFELIFRKRIPPKYEGMAHAIGFVFIIGLLIYINLQDFINPITLP